MDKISSVKSHERNQNQITVGNLRVGSTGYIYNPDREQYIYYKVISIEPSVTGGSYIKGKCFYIEMSGIGDGYSVYRDNITFNPYHDYKYQLSAGWQVLPGLELNEAKEFCKNNLKYLK